MTEYQVGQKIKIEFEGTVREHGVSDELCTEVADSMGRYHYIVLGSGGVTVTTQDPEHWPPEVGDIWKANDREYYVRQNRMSRSSVTVAAFEDSVTRDYIDEEQEKFKALNPVLIRRRGSW